MNPHAMEDLQPEEIKSVSVRRGVTRTSPPRPLLAVRYVTASGRVFTEGIALAAPPSKYQR